MDIPYFIQLFLTLSVLIGVLVCVLKFGKLYQKKRYEGNIQLVDRIPIDNKVTLVIVKVKKKDYLFSIGGTDIKLIEKLE